MRGMVKKTSPTVWIYDHAPWLLAVAVALAIGAMLGIGGTMIDGKYSAFTLLGSVLGAGLGAAGGIVGGLVVQRRRRLDDFRSPAEKLLGTIEWVDRIVKMFLESDDGFLDEKFIDGFLELRGKEIDRIHGLGTEMNGLIEDVQLDMREVQTFAQFVGRKKEKGEDHGEISNQVKKLAERLRVSLAVLNGRLRAIVDAR
jgi:hypothetical protein